MISQLVTNENILVTFTFMRNNIKHFLWIQFFDGYLRKKPFIIQPFVICIFDWMSTRIFSQIYHFLSYNLGVTSVIQKKSSLSLHGQIIGAMVYNMTVYSL